MLLVGVICCDDNLEQGLLLGFFMKLFLTSHRAAAVIANRLQDFPKLPAILLCNNLLKFWPNQEVFNSKNNNNNSVQTHHGSMVG